MTGEVAKIHEDNLESIGLGLPHFFVVDRCGISHADAEVALEIVDKVIGEEQCRVAEAFGRSSTGIIRFAGSMRTTDLGLCVQPQDSSKLLTQVNRTAIDASNSEVLLYQTQGLMFERLAETAVRGAVAYLSQRPEGSEFDQ